VAALRHRKPNSTEVALAVGHPDPSIASAAYAIRAWFHATNEAYGLHVADLRRAVAFATLPARELVAASLRTVCGQPLRPSYVVQEVDREEAPAAPSDEELIARFKSEFDAEEIS